MIILGRPDSPRAGRYLLEGRDVSGLDALTTETVRAKFARMRCARDLLQEGRSIEASDAGAAAAGSQVVPRYA